MPAPITAGRLAEETGVSPRSIYRDIDALRAAGAQIEGERGYGYRLMEDVALPPQTLDEVEIEALIIPRFSGHTGLAGHALLSLFGS